MLTTAGQTNTLESTRPRGANPGASLRTSWCNQRADATDSTVRAPLDQLPQQSRPGRDSQHTCPAVVSQKSKAGHHASAKRGHYSIRAPLTPCAPDQDALRGGLHGKARVRIVGGETLSTRKAPQQAQAVRSWGEGACCDQNQEIA